MYKFLISLFKRVQVSRKGSGILSIAIITAILISIVSFAYTNSHQVFLFSAKRSNIILQAKQYCDAEVNVVRGTSYSDLEDKVKTEIAGSNGFYSEILLSEETTSSGINQRTAVVNIYDGGILPCYSQSVLKSSATGGYLNSLPVGTVIAWASSIAPNEGGIWLLCNGGSFSSATYPKLYSVLGKTTLPSLNGRFLEGTTGTPGSTKSAGLPNITGYLKSTDGANQFSDMERYATSYSGALVGYFKGTYNIINSSPSGTYLVGFDFDASKSNSIYGASTTVQPASYLVRYYIKAS